MTLFGYDRGLNDDRKAIDDPRVPRQKLERNIGTSRFQRDVLALRLGTHTPLRMINDFGRFTQTLCGRAMSTYIHNRIHKAD